jgi:DhnA family fructose-bisphosphate aldolase class Ia
MDSRRATKGGADMLACELQTASPHDILQAWQDGSIGYREAYQACRSSGVTIRGGLTARELQGVDAAVSDLIGPQGNA